MNIFQKLWAWMSGKKTAAGAVLLIAGTVIPLIPAAAVAAPAAPYLLTAGTALGGVGVLHKIFKAGQDASHIVAMLPPSHAQAIAQAVLAILPPTPEPTVIIQAPIAGGADAATAPTP